MNALNQFHRVFSVLAAICAAAITATPGRAQVYPTGPAGNAQMVTISAATLQNIVDRLDALEAQQKVAEDPAWVDVSTEKFKNKYGGRIMGDYVMFPNQSAGSVARFGDVDNYFEFRRLRFFMQGEGYGVFTYKFDLGFQPEAIRDAPDSGVEVKDVYLGAKHVPWLGTVELGFVKQPYSLEVLTSSKYINFLERAMPTDFLAVRRLGFRSTNHSPDESLFWQWAVFFDDFSDVDHERVDDNQGMSLVGRIVATPYYCQDGRYLVHVGVMGAWADDRDDSVRVRTRPEVHESPHFVDSGAIDAEDYYDVGAQMAVNWGQWGLQSELFYKRVRGFTQDFDFKGAYVMASYFITGEHRAYKRSVAHFDRVKPFTNFWFVRGSDGLDWGWGAWQTVARWTFYDVSEATGANAGNAGKENNLAVGVNWYWNPYSRVMIDWTHAWNKYNTGADAEADIIGMRYQVDW